jgi:chemotaxis regulatin CheY-phosphate phosphatase CheZ
MTRKQKAHTTEDTPDAFSRMKKILNKMAHALQRTMNALPHHDEKTCRILYKEMI